MFIHKISTRVVNGKHLWILKKKNKQKMCSNLKKKSVVKPLRTFH